MNGKELIKSYWTKADQIADLEKKIETKRIRAQHLADAANRNGSITNFVNLMRERNNLITDIETCRRKIENLRKGLPANGLHDYELQGYCTRRPGGID
jgi:hypothetical protein